MKFGFKVNYMNKEIEKHTSLNFEDIYDELEIKLLEIYDSENYTSINDILKDYDKQELTEKDFKEGFNFININDIVRLSVILFYTEKE